MKSIRLSLLLYFFVLLALALGAASVLAYRNMEQTLQAKEETRRELLKDRNERERRREGGRLDRELLLQARTLAGQVRFQIQWSRSHSLLFAPLGMLSAGLDPNGCLFLPIWLVDAEHHRSTYFERLLRRSRSEIQLDEKDLPPPADGQVKEYIQIDSEGGSTWRSQSMVNRFFPFDASMFATVPMYVPKFDDTELAPGLRVRRVILKAPVAHLLIIPGRPPRPEAPRRQWLSSSEGRPHHIDSEAIFIQCATETKQRDAALAALKDKLDNELAELKAESQNTLASLRNRLVLIGLATFAATLLGGIWLVGLGLSPLRRLSEAVSQVSPKDFRLPLDKAPLPSELRPIAERLAQTLELLKRAFAREKQAAADISHELRTPLAALLTTIEVALRKPRAPEEYRDLMTDCHATGRQMSQLVERLLALARLDAGADTLRPREVDVAALAEQCTTLVRPLAEARGLSLRMRPNGPVSMSTDPDKFREILTNLLHNAIEYNRPNGSVEVAVEQQNGNVHLEVRDTGIGITPEARAHIFERFYRAEPSRHAEGLHAGLGLAIVKGYVDLMGGKIDVQSTAGEGSVFCLRFPAQGRHPS